MYLMSHLSSRNELPKWLNELGLTDTAVEVGTHRGIYARIFLSRWKGKTLYCVDPWEEAVGYEDQAQHLEHSTGDRVRDYQYCVRYLSLFKGRVEIIKGTSMEALRKLHRENIRPDFVYLDGNHEPPHVEVDIKEWWDILKPGGVLAGHDIVCPGPDRDDNWGKYIQPVVQEFFKGHEVNLIVEEGGLPWTYHVRKGG